MEQAALLWGVLLPGLIVGVGMLLIPKPSEQGSRFSWGSLLLALAFACGYLGLFGVPPIPSSSRTLAATDWLVWMIPAGGLVLFSSIRVRPLSVAVRLQYAALTLGLVLRATVEYQWEGVEVAVWLVGIFALGLASWFSYRGLVARAPGASIPACLLVLLTGLATCSALTGSAKIGQLVGLLCAGVGAFWIVSWMRPGVRLLGNELTLIVTATLGFGLCAHFYSELPGLEGSLLALGGFAPWLAELPIFRAQSERTRGVLRVVMVLLVVGAAVALSVSSFDPDPYGEYEY